VDLEAILNVYKFGTVYDAKYISVPLRDKAPPDGMNPRFIRVETAPVTSSYCLILLLLASMRMY
jgi:hypothetical protein